MSFKKPFRAAPVRLGPYYLEKERRKSLGFAAKVLGAAVVAGLAIGAASSQSGLAQVAAVRKAGPASTGQARRTRPVPDVYYSGCNEARAAGAAPIYRGQPGYRPEMDGDSDGIACEPYRGRR